MNFDDVVRIGSQLPEVEVSTSYGTPSLKVRTKSFCRMWGDAENERKGPIPAEVLVVFVELEDKQGWIDSADGALFDQDHYRGHGAMLVRLDLATDELLTDVLEQSWRLKAPKTLVKKLES